MTLLAMLAVLAGCWFSPSISRVWPPVVDDVRRIGGIVADTTSELSWEGHTTVTNVLVVDTRNTDSRKALEKVVALAKGRGWAVDSQGMSDRVSMRSDRWENTRLSLTRIASYQVDEFEDPRLAKVIRRLWKRPGSAGLVILQLDRTDRP
ncbi:hypothetical protein F5972_33275 [Microbispora cellulosiformans]|uniref:Uncharacterized protein n=1 Tax=Microbispora cellulosiformans TaxID=2614688 RepID=A0A5J5JVI2_9ACTN|nr:hypothetical protein [Microbispora cellulosiformans]KAA9374093.1 hypothetical protein F5972_33275 [Microbispora cellulosiformans]